MLYDNKLNNLPKALTKIINSVQLDCNRGVVRGAEFEGNNSLVGHHSLLFQNKGDVMYVIVVVDKGTRALCQTFGTFTDQEEAARALLSNGWIQSKFSNENFKKILKFDEDLPEDKYIAFISELKPPEKMI